MRKLLLAAVTVLVAAGTGFATTASAAPAASGQAAFTCSHFQDPTVELVWSHVCRF